MNFITRVLLFVVVAAVTVYGQGGGPGGGQGGRPRNKCPAEITFDDKGVIQWPSGNPGSTVERICPSAKRQEDSQENSDEENTNATMATRECMSTDDVPMWGEPDTSECMAESGRGNRLKHLRGLFIPPGQAKKMGELLTNATEDAENFEEEEINDAAGTAVNIVDSIENGTDSDTARSVLRGVSNMLNTRLDKLKASQKSEKSAVRLLRAVERLAELVEVKGSQPVTMETEGIVITATATNASSYEGVSYLPDSAELSKERDGRQEPNRGKSKIDLPATLLDKVDNKEMVDRIQFATFKSAKFFQAADENTPDDVVVLGASVGADLRVQGLTDRVKITFPRPENSEGYVCGFWDEDRNDGTGRWSGEGVVTDTAGDSNVTVCESNHLTNFALLPAAAIDGAGQLAVSTSLFGLLLSIIMVYIYG